MMIRRVARSVSSKLIPPSNWYLKRSISPPIPFSRSPPSTNLADKEYSEIDVNIMALFRPHTGDSIVKYTRLRRLQDSSKMENAKRKPIFYVYRVSRGYTVLTPISLEDDGSLSNKHSISHAFDFEFDLDPPKYYSCNGLFCYRDINCDDHELFVWNPTTMETRKLPISPHTFEPPTDDPHCIYNEVTVPFDSLTKVDTFVATWADPESEDYKLLRYYTFYDDNVDFYASGHYRNFCPTQLELYSLKTDSWKKLCWKGGPDSGISSCYIDGVIYMLTNNRCSGIVSFDFRTETFSTIPFPTHVCHVSSYELVNCNGQLNLLCFRCKFPYALVEMTHWVMSNGEWDCVSRYHDVPGVLRPLGFARNGELLLFSSAVHWEPKIHSSLMVFDSTTGVIKHLPGLASRCHINLFNFAETFIKLKPSGEQEKEDGRANAIQEQVINIA